MNTILFTGGGTAGHVTPNIALIQKFLDSGWKVIYVGSKKGVEKNMISQMKIPYHQVATGKLRRYFSWQTFIEPFFILFGIFQAVVLCHKLKPKIVFSKGGFVAFPVVVGAWLNRIPVVVHESDLTPGLANRLSFPFATKVCVTFPEGKKFFKPNKAIVTGTPIRDSLLLGKSEKGRALCHFNNEKPVLLVIGGGQGSSLLNTVIRAILPKLLQEFHIVHLCGKGKTAPELNNTPNYIQFEYLNEELGDIYACADVVVSRSGANSLYELLTLKKPHILIPLARRASRGDQIVNAKYFAAKGLSHVILEEELTPERLFTDIVNVNTQKERIHKDLLEFVLPDSKQLIYQELTELAISDKRA